jgi:hypothetical protein
MAQLDGHRNLGDVRIRSRVTACGIFGAESDIEEGVFSSVLCIYPVSIIPPVLLLILHSQGLDTGWKVWGSKKYFSSSPVQTGIRAHTASCTVGTVAISLGKAAGSRRWLLFLMQLLFFLTYLRGDLYL